LVLSEIDLEGKPEFEDADPSAEKCIQEIVDLSRNLKFAETKLCRMSFLYALPFLLGLRGTRWTLINLIAAPLLRVVKKSRKKLAK
jgi:hypothetical protein